jgi:hypothetical protein
METSPFSKKQFHENGYCIFPNVIPGLMIKSALKAINASLCKGMPPSEIERYNSRSFCPELMHDPRLMGLFLDTSAYPIAESFIGRGKLKDIQEA